MAIKNYTSDKPIDKIFAELQQTLGTHGAKHISFEYGDDGVISHKRGKENTYGYEQAYRVAWRNILDWVLAQMALLEIGMAKMEEVFLPYMQDRDGVTFFERMEERGFLLSDGKQAAERPSA